eukprot:3804429-Pleurochrysis_carterae.AAC.2
MHGYDDAKLTCFGTTSCASDLALSTMIRTARHMHAHLFLPQVLLVTVVEAACGRDEASLVRRGVGRRRVGRHGARHRRRQDRHRHQLRPAAVNEGIRPPGRADCARGQEGHELLALATARAAPFQALHGQGGQVVAAAAAAEAPPGAGGSAGRVRRGA